MSIIISKGRGTLSKNENTFNEWIQTTGVNVIAKKLRTGRTTVENWLSGKCDPRVIQMREIKRITKGVIGYDEIIDRKHLPPRRRVVSSS